MNLDAFLVKYGFLGASYALREVGQHDQLTQNDKQLLREIANDLEEALRSCEGKRLS